MKQKAKEFQEFLKAIQAKYPGSIDTEKPGEKPWSSYHSYNDTKKEKGHWISNRWSTGGVSGGSCWDTGEESNHYSTSGETEPNFEILDDILLMFCPNLSFLQYKKLTEKVIEHDEWTEPEYYGNSTNYAVKFVNLQKLFDVLREMELL